MKVGINGFGRIGRLSMRAAWEMPELEIVHVNEIKGGASTAAYMLQVNPTLNHELSEPVKTLLVAVRFCPWSMES